MFQTMPIFTKSKHNASRVKKNKDAEKTSKEPQRPDRDRERVRPPKTASDNFS